MIQKMGYFRIKKTGLDRVFESFIIKNLKKNYPFITVECDFTWPSLKLSGRHLFQLGGFGAIDPYEYLKGGKRVERFLKRVCSPIKKWETFEPSGEFPEAEWGFCDECLTDIKSFLKKNKIPLIRIKFGHPEGISNLTAELYKFWYKKRGRRSQILLVENFGLIVPYDTVETISTPFWLAFNTEDSYKRLKAFLQSRGKFGEIYIMLMSNGVAEGIGLTKIEEWKKILRKVGKKGDFIGVNEREYPSDFGTYLEYNEEIKEKMPKRFPFPEPLTLKEFYDFIQKNESGEDYTIVRE